jgi:hypothetical protein
LAFLTRRADLLELELPEPNLSLYATDCSNPDQVNCDDLNPDGPKPTGDPHEPGQEQ